MLLVLTVALAEVSRYGWVAGRMWATDAKDAFALVFDNSANVWQIPVWGHKGLGANDRVESILHDLSDLALSVLWHWCIFWRTG